MTAAVAAAIAAAAPQVVRTREERVMSSSEDLDKLLKKAPNKANWKKVCELLDVWPAGLMGEALEQIEAEAARWDVDTNNSEVWPMPARYTPAAWTKRLLAGDAPAGFGAVRFLQYHAAKVQDAGLERILKTGALGQITHLYLGSCRLGADALPLLARHHEQLGALTHLVMTDNKLDQTGLEALIASPLAQRLITLNLSSCSFSSVEPLISAPLPALRVLDLGCCDLTAAHEAALRMALPQLTHLTAS
jgi:hypothetical protein